MAGRDFDPERFADAVEHVAVPGRGFVGTDVPQAQIDVEVRAFYGSDAAEVEDVLQIAFCCFAGEFCVGVRRKVDLTDCGACENLPPGSFDGGTVCREREFERRLLQFLEVVYEAGVERGFAENVKIDVCGADFLRFCDTLFKKFARHECSRFGELGICAFVRNRLTARAKAAMQIADIRDFDIDAVHGGFLEVFLLRLF